MTIACDVSYYNPPVDDSYPHRWLIFRACDGDFVDPNAGRNLTWVKKARADGRLDGFTVYVVYRPGMNTTILAILDRLTVPPDCTVMIDAETWGGQITGDHSAAMNALAASLATRQGSRDRVWGYGNRGDLASMWRLRPAWLGVVVASYGSSKPTDVAHMVGWQYTDGQAQFDIPGLPASSPPFGRCDHNELYLPTGETPMTPAEMQAVAQAVWDHQYTHVDEATGAKNSKNRSMAQWLTNLPWSLADISAAVKASGVVLTDAQVQAIADSIAAKIPQGTGFTVQSTVTPKAGA